MAKTAHPLRFLVTGALLVGPMACGDTAIEDLPTHNEAPLPEVQPEVEEPEVEQAEVQQPEEQSEEAAALDEPQAPAVVDPSLAGIDELLGEVSTNAVAPHSQPSSLHSMDPAPQK